MHLPASERGAARMAALAMGKGPIFIVGAPRSGTKLFRDMLSAHPRLSFPPESHFIPAFYRAFGDPSSEREAVRLARAIMRYSWVWSWRLPLDPEELAGHRTFAGLTAELFEAWARKEGKPRWGDKTPGYVSEIPLVLSLFPDAQFLHIYRDGRDVVRSVLPMNWSPGNAFCAAELWRDSVRDGRAAGPALPEGRYMDVRYEQLVRDPEPVMRRVCDFLGEDYDPSVTRPKRPRGSLRAAHLPPVESGPIETREELSASRVELWRSEMRPSDVAMVEAVAGELLNELGYPLSGAPRKVHAGERAAWHIHGRVVRLARSVKLADPLRVRIGRRLILWRAGVRRRLHGQRSRGGSEAPSTRAGS